MKNSYNTLRNIASFIVGAYGILLLVFGKMGMNLFGLVILFIGFSLYVRASDYDDEERD